LLTPAGTGSAAGAALGKGEGAGRCEAALIGRLLLLANRASLTGAALFLLPDALDGRATGPEPKLPELHALALLPTFHSRSSE
jgi:hypothetical protein